MRTVRKRQLSAIKLDSALCHSSSETKSYLISLHWGNKLLQQVVVGGAEEIRTPDLRRAKAALSQLSYGPLFCHTMRLRPVCYLTQLTPALVSGGPWWTRTTGLGLIRTAL
jgi:hypothetical protein